MAQTKIAGLFLDPTVISGLTAITDGDPDADYLFIWDAGTSTLKKIYPDNLGLAALDGAVFTGTVRIGGLLIADGTGGGGTGPVLSAQTTNEDLILVPNGTGMIILDGKVTSTQLDILAQGDLRLQDSSGGQYIAFDSPATVSTSYTVTMPAGLPVADKVLKVTSISSNVATMEWGTAGGARSVAGDTDNGLMTWVTSDNTFAAEANLTFDGTTLTTPGQIAFPASVALSSNANTLDDYQEGTFTPILHDWSFDGTEATHTRQVGRYVKIGRFVYFWGYVAWDDLGTLAVGSQGLIGGLPFTSMAGTGYNTSVTIGHAYGLGLPAAGQNPTATINANTAYISFHVWSSTSGVQSMNFSRWGPNPEANFAFSGFYETNS